MKLPHEPSTDQAPDATHIFREMIRGKYFYLLMAMLLMTVLAPVLQGVRIGADGGIRITDVLYALILLAAVLVIKRSHRHVLIALTMIVPAAALSLVAYKLPNQPYVVVPGHLLLFVFVMYMMGLMLADVLLARRVTADTIMGAVCIYLLIALAWAMLFSLCAYVDPEAFRVADATIDPAEMVFHRDRFGTVVYFSLITLTTLGYGDIVPNAPITQSLAALESAIGPVYLAVLVARLVGMHIHAAPRIEE